MHEIPPYMGDFSDEDLAWVARNGIQERVPAGGVIIREGEPLDAVFVILEGTFSVSVAAIGEPELFPLGPGEIAGEMSYIHNQLPLGTVRAETDAVVLRIPRERLDAKIREDVGFAGRFHKVVADFTIDRFYSYNWGRLAPIRPEAHRGKEEGDTLRVYELIERMLRGEFPRKPKPPEEEEGK